MRRRELAPPPATSVPVPLWVRNLGAGFRHVNGRPLADAVTTDDLSRDLRRWREAKARWCAKNGCHRQGKPCREVFADVPEDCRKAGGPGGAVEGRDRGGVMPLKVGEPVTKPAQDDPEMGEESTPPAEPVEVDTTAREEMI